MKDNYGRKIDYMRISITERCNLRCEYCMPDGIPLVPVSDILTYEEIVTICRAAAEVGIRKFKITGGEPLIRRGCAELIGMLKKIPGIEQVTMTTNGILLGEYLPELLENGLDAVNVSLDTLDRKMFRSITGYDGLPGVLQSIGQAIESGLRVKVNSVLREGVNDSEWLKLAELTLDRPLDVRFIELMPIGCGKDGKAVCNEEILEKLREQYPDINEDRNIHGNGPATYYRIPGASGSVGFISAMHGKFCGSCNRIRLTSQGKIKPCLCFGEEVDLHNILRSRTNTEEQMKEAILRAVKMKPESHRFEVAGEVTERRKMVRIGG